MGRSALLVSAHPPGSGSGTGVRAELTIAALRSCCDRVDTVSLALPSEDARAGEVLLIPRAGEPGLLGRIVDLGRGGSYYGAERRAGVEAHLQKAVAKGRLEPRYDLLWIGPQSLCARSALSAVDASARVLDVDSVVAANIRRLADDPDLPLYHRWFRRVTAAVVARGERRRCNQVDLVTVASELEWDRLGDVNPEVAVLPNAVPPGAPIRFGNTGPSLLFVGSLHYEANIDAVRWFVEAILPRVRALRPDAELTVAGSSPTGEIVELCAQPNVRLVPNPPTLEPIYSGARVVVAPIRLGGGTRLKLLEAMAHGAAVVATSAAVEGLPLEDEREILTADSPEEFAERCTELLNDVERAARLGQAALKTWSSQYRPERAQEQIVALVERVLSSKGARASSGRPSPAARP